MKTTKSRIRDVFAAAHDEDSAEAVQQYLDQACGDNVELRREVEELLRAHHDAGEFLGGTAPANLFGPQEMPNELCGTTVGPYKLLEAIGEGGMGTVYMAQQSDPVKRRVAVKLIKAGMDSKQVIARFEAERQALAVMDHPNIAKVFDAGTSETGCPYFVMELVKGKPITQFCDEQKLDIENRLKLFQHICHAVQHAHQKGIIHRDIKPSNVLVAMYDGRPVPKVIDFGVAKATGEELTEKTMFTRFGQIVGTLEYMSPEQAQFNQLDIDTRSDVYSLGAVLYELLAGEPPFERQRLKSQALDETLRMIREEEPTKPSTKLHSSASAAQAAANRTTTSDKLNSMVRGDLDWIVMKAIDKDRTCRYATADEFALEIDRYLDNEPVNAGPPSASYRIRKFARRNKTALAFGITVATAMLLGIMGTTWQAIRATNAASEAERQTRIAQAVEQFWNEDVLLQADPLRKTIRQPNRDIKLREVFDIAADKIKDRFGEEPLVAAEVYKILSTGYCNLGQHEQALELVYREIPLRESQLGVDDPTSIDARSRLGLFLNNTGKTDQAIFVLVRELALCGETLPANDAVTLETMNRLARAYMQAKKFDEAQQLLEQTLERETEIHGVNHPNVCATLTMMGALCSKTGKDEEAERLFKQALDIFEPSNAASHPYQVFASQQLGRHFARVENFLDAQSNLRKAWLMAKEIYGVEHETTKMVGRQFADSLTALRRSSFFDEGEKGVLNGLLYARGVLEELTEAYPDDLDLKIALAGNLCNSGIVLSQGDEPNQSIECAYEAIAVLDDVLLQDPKNAKAVRFRTNTQYMLAHVLLETGDYDQSVVMFEQSIDRLLKNGDLVRPNALERSVTLGLNYMYCGRSCEKLKEFEKAADYYERANGVFIGVLAEKPDHQMVQGQLLDMLDWSVRLYGRQLKRPADMLRCMDQIATINSEKAEDVRYSLFRELLRAYVLAHAGEYQEGIEIADAHCLQPTDEVESSWSGWAWAASAYARSAQAVLDDETIAESERVAFADEYSEKAVGILRRVVVGDEYSTPSARKELLEDEEYTVLRDREDFKQLLQEK